MDKKPLLPTDSAARKAIPVASGLFDYFPSALIAVAAVSHAGNAKHNAGLPLQWRRGLSDDHADTMLRHFLERGTVDTVPDVNGNHHRHSAMMAWRALAILQLELEAEGAPVAVTPKGKTPERDDQWSKDEIAKLMAAPFEPSSINRLPPLFELKVDPRKPETWRPGDLVEKGVRYVCKPEHAEAFLEAQPVSKVTPDVTTIEGPDAPFRGHEDEPIIP